MANNSIFSIKRDQQIIKAGGFLCVACLVGKPATKQSPDPRYCLDCHKSLLKEAALLSGQPEWCPRATTGKISSEKPVKVSQHTDLIKSTLETKKITVDIIPPQTPKLTRGKRGPKHRELPQDFIRQLATEGMGSKAIASQLRDEGITISYKTVQRILSGERQN